MSVHSEHLEPHDANHRVGGEQSTATEAIGYPAYNHKNAEWREKVRRAMSEDFNQEEEFFKKWKNKRSHKRIGTRIENKKNGKYRRRIAELKNNIEELINKKDKLSQIK